MGRWDAWLKPEAAGGPYVLAVGGDGATVTVRDVMLGDVWFASGQSNMEMPLAGFPRSAYVKNAAAEIAAATDPHVRLPSRARSPREHVTVGVEGHLVFP